MNRFNLISSRLLCGNLFCTASKATATSSATLLSAKQFSENADLKTKIDPTVHTLNNEMLDQHEEEKERLLRILSQNQISKVQSIHTLLAQLSGDQQVYVLLRTQYKST